jgi:hypothetical protein
MLLGAGKYEEAKRMALEAADAPKLIPRNSEVELEIAALATRLLSGSEVSESEYPRIKEIMLRMVGPRISHHAAYKFGTYAYHVQDHAFAREMFWIVLALKQANKNSL